ncbi:MAG: hypothetical protein IT214_10785 [Chitinophagaceae bacterium]|jgi:hypothetical protein|nr:hypothetical protein [Chitinophagaceae bacterium]OQY93561.1 MAG: hypothetical protein B6D37_10730 [Sphingobacteriales bacterium UTBCD1]
MKSIVAIILTGLLAFLGGMYMQWWSLAIAAFLIALLVPQKSGKAFLSGFLGVFLLWSILAWWIDIRNEGILAKKIAAVLPLGGNEYLLILVTAFLGGLVAGFAALSGSFLRSSKS